MRKGDPVPKAVMAAWGFKALRNGSFVAPPRHECGNCKDAGIPCVGDPLQLTSTEGVFVRKACHECGEGEWCNKAKGYRDPHALALYQEQVEHAAKVERYNTTTRKMNERAARKAAKRQAREERQKEMEKEKEEKRDKAREQEGYGAKAKIEEASREAAQLAAEQHDAKLDSIIENARKVAEELAAKLDAFIENARQDTEEHDAKLNSIVGRAIVIMDQLDQNTALFHNQETKLVSLTRTMSFLLNNVESLQDTIDDVEKAVKDNDEAQTAKFDELKAYIKKCLQDRDRAQAAKFRELNDAMRALDNKNEQMLNLLKTISENAAPSNNYAASVNSHAKAMYKASAPILGLSEGSAPHSTLKRKSEVLETLTTASEDLESETESQTSTTKKAKSGKSDNSKSKSAISKSDTETLTTKARSQDGGRRADADRALAQLFKSDSPTPFRFDFGDDEKVERSKDYDFLDDMAEESDDSGHSREGDEGSCGSGNGHSSCQDSESESHDGESGSDENSDESSYYSSDENGYDRLSESHIDDEPMEDIVPIIAIVRPLTVETDEATVKSKSPDNDNGKLPTSLHAEEEAMNDRPGAGVKHKSSPQPAGIHATRNKPDDGKPDDVSKPGFGAWLNRAAEAVNLKEKDKVPQPAS